MAGIAVVGRQGAVAIVHPAIRRVELAGDDTDGAGAVQRFDDAPLIAGREIGERAVDRLGEHLPGGEVIGGGDLRWPAACGDGVCLQAAHIRGGGRASGGAIHHPLDDAVALAIVEVFGRHGGIGGGVLPGGEVSLDIPGEGLAVRCAATRRRAAGGAAGHIPTDDVAGADRMILAPPYKELLSQMLDQGDFHVNLSGENHLPPHEYQGHYFLLPAPLKYVSTAIVEAPGVRPNGDILHMLPMVARYV